MENVGKNYNLKILKLLNEQKNVEKLFSNYASINKFLIFSLGKQKKLAMDR